MVEMRHADNHSKRFAQLHEQPQHCNGIRAARHCHADAFSGANSEALRQQNTQRLRQRVAFRRPLLFRWFFRRHDPATYPNNARTPGRVPANAFAKWIFL
jgi:hypothetical protein